ncbi:MAG: HAD-IA family hydrolase [Rhodoblastus sp.]|nr:MAG: HAD-IA family hydrolase [Rhodoblastus sp.]
MAPHGYASAQFGLRKPDPAIFAAACARIGVAPGRTLFVDDLAENVAGARAAGLRGHVFPVGGGGSGACGGRGSDWSEVDSPPVVIRATLGLCAARPPSGRTRQSTKSIRRKPAHSHLGGFVHSMFTSMSAC